GDFHWYRHLINPDGISYIDIARQYLAGHWSQAVNEYWGPLFSWLLVPLLKFGLEPLVAAKIVNLVVGFGLLGGFFCLAKRYLALWLAIAMTVLVLPVVFSWTLGGYITPDLLLTMLLVWYVYVVLSPRFEARPGLAVVAGLLAGLAYLAKSYSLPFFIL